MSWLKTIARELVGLFVDDGRQALSIIVWLCVCGLVLTRLALPSGWLALVWFVGLIVILVESVSRRMRRC